VIHRDLKPANIMVGDFGEVYVMDWGLAKVVQSQEPIPLISADPSIAARPGHDNISMAPNIPMAAPLPSYAGSVGKVVTSRDDCEDLTQAGAIMGTPVYMPPEQAKGLPNAVDQRSDVYSLGAILYEILTLVPPVEKTGGHIAVLMRVVKGEILPPEVRSPERRHKIPPELSAIAMKALALEPSRRYQSVEALRIDLELYLAGRSVSAKQDTFREQAWKLVKRNKGASIASSAALVILMFVVGYFLSINYAARLYAEQQQHKAEDALTKFETEQKAKAEAIRRSVPALVRAGRQLANDGELTKAAEQVDLALSYASDDADAILLKGQIALSHQHWADARAEFERYRKLNSQDDDVTKILRDLDHLRPDDPSTFHPVCVWLQQSKLSGLAQPLLSIMAKNLQAREKLLPLYRKQIDAAHPGLASKLHFDGASQLRLDVGSQPGVTDLNFLRGIPLQICIFRHAKVDDLSPLSGMPLEYLDLGACSAIKKLDPLRGMPLRTLDLSTADSSNRMQIEDLEPLRGMKLENLRIGLSKVTSLEPLRGMPLKNLNIRFSSVRDLEPLRSMPLERLDAGGYNFDSLEPLRGTPLKFLSLDGSNSRPLSLEPLTESPLKYLTIGYNGAIRDLRPLTSLPLEEIELRTPVEHAYPPESLKALRQNTSLKLINRYPAAEFWKRYDAGEFKK
jgi:hypothetical protein